MPVIDCKDFLLYAAPLLNWGELSGKVCMDVGCGRGMNSTYRFIKMFPDIAKLIAIDIHTDDIEKAKEVQYEFGPKVDFFYGRINDRSTLTEWEGQMQAIVSHYCFNCIQDQKTAFQNLYTLLDEGGSAALLFTLWANFYQWSMELGELYGPFSSHFASEPPESYTKNYHVADYTRMLTEIGFEIVHSEDEEECIRFETDVQCKRYLGSICPITNHVPIEDKDDFLGHIFLHFLRHNPRDSQGLVCVKHRAAKFLLRKPIPKE